MSELDYIIDMIADLGGQRSVKRHGAGNVKSFWTTASDIVSEESLSISRHVRPQMSCKRGRRWGSAPYQYLLRLMGDIGKGGTKILALLALGMSTSRLKVSLLPQYSSDQCGLAALESPDAQHMMARDSIVLSGRESQAGLA